MNPEANALLLGKGAIDLLVKQNLPVTLKTVSEKSKEIDSEGKGIHPNTITTNPELNEYYKQHSKTYKQKSNSNQSLQKCSVAFPPVDYRRISAERNIENAERKYMKMSKRTCTATTLGGAIYCRKQSNLDRGAI